MMKRRRAQTIEECCKELAIRLVKLQREYPSMAKDMGDLVCDYIRAAIGQTLPACNATSPLVD